jgi:hypothetical protein
MKALSSSEAHFDCRKNITFCIVIPYLEGDKFWARQEIPSLL